MARSASHEVDPIAHASITYLLPRNCLLRTTCVKAHASHAKFYVGAAAVACSGLVPARWQWLDCGLFHRKAVVAVILWANPVSASSEAHLPRLDLG